MILKNNSYLTLVGISVVRNAFQGFFQRFLREAKLSANVSSAARSNDFETSAVSSVTNICCFATCYSVLTDMIDCADNPEKGQILCCLLLIFSFVLIEILKS